LQKLYHKAHKGGTKVHKIVVGADWVFEKTTMKKIFNFIAIETFDY
jgi:hypothetical protein